MITQLNTQEIDYSAKEVFQQNIHRGIQNKRLMMIDEFKDLSENNLSIQRVPLNYNKTATAIENKLSAQNVILNLNTA